MPDIFDNRSTHSEEVDDIIGRAPIWVVRRGNIVIACIVALLLLGACLIRYPDVVSATVIISGSAPPVKLVSMSNGRIVELNAKDGEQIKAGEIVSVIENPAKTQDMLYLKRVVESIDTTLDISKAIIGVNLFKNRSVQVGELQADYATLYQAIMNYSFFLGNKYYAGKKKAITSQQDENNKIKRSIEDRSRLLSDQLAIEKWRDSVNQTLVKNKVISRAEYNEIRKNYLSQKMANTENIGSIMLNQQQNREYQKSLSDIEQQYNTEQRDVSSAIRDAAKKIKGDIAEWERKYVIRSPLSGQLTFFKIWTINQYATAGEALFMVVPNAQHMVVRAQLPIYKAGKIKVGQLVLIKLQEYPYAEFGMLKAKVSRLTNVALDSAYTVQLQLDNGLHTTLNRNIASRPEITGTADIITNNKSILSRIFEGIYGKIYSR